MSYIHWLYEQFVSMNEQLVSMDVNIFNAMWRLLLSMILGAVVGAERKNKGQIAGIRTFALISMGACLAMLLSIYVPQEYMGFKNGDPGRIAAQVITGIGFLGGGAMIQMKGSVRGLTTAAGIWVTAIIGMAVGVGMYGVSVGATIMILVVLVLFERYEKWRGMGQVSKVINLYLYGIVYDVKAYKKVLAQNDIHIRSIYAQYDYDNNTSELNMVILAHARQELIPVLEKLKEVNKTKAINISNVVEI